jgi:hypothetical protein
VFLAVLLVASAAQAAQTIIIKERTEWTEPMTTFNLEHDDDWAPAVLYELRGGRFGPDATPVELAQATLDLLNGLPTYGQKQTAEVRPAIPRWFLDGYTQLNPVNVAHSRYLDAVDSGALAPNGDIGALYAFWCAYDAEWFSLSMHADYKAWFSAVLLHYPPAWQRLRGESEWDLHGRLVAPLQTPDEPYREIDNWINNFVKHGEAFAKPKVRDALVEELLARAGLETDERFYDDPAYSGPTPSALGLSEREFFLMAALSLEYFQEIYVLEPTGKQILHFRDYFIQTYYGAMR